MASPLTPEVLTLLESIHRDATASRFFSGEFSALVTFVSLAHYLHSGGPCRAPL